MQSEKHQFIGSQGFRLMARLDSPAQGESKAFALFAHCFTCTKNLKAVSNITRSLTENSIAVLRFDFTGLGESEGDFADTNFSSNVGDLVKAAEFLESKFEPPKILIGHSLGRSAVLQAARFIPPCQAVATIAAPYDPEHVTHLLVSVKGEIDELGEAKILLAGREFKIKKQFLDDLEEHNMQKNIADIERALLIFYSPVDDIVGIDNAAKIFIAAKHPKSFISLDNADHLLMRKEDSQYVSKMVATWAKKYI
jgi:alpha/beta superfamily hydrolase